MCLKVYVLCVLLHKSWVVYYLNLLTTRPILNVLTFKMHFDV